MKQMESSPVECRARGWPGDAPPDWLERGVVVSGLMAFFCENFTSSLVA